MFINRECDYAIRTVRHLADREKKAVREISDAEAIPMPYTYKILKKLEKAGLVKSSRGPSGGYQLERDTDSITLCDIMTAVEDDLFVTECVRRGFVCEMNTPGKPCTLHREFCRIQRVLMEALQEKTLAQILRGEDS